MQSEVLAWNDDLGEEEKEEWGMGRESGRWKDGVVLVGGLRRNSRLCQRQHGMKKQRR